MVDGGEDHDEDDTENNDDGAADIGRSDGYKR